MRYVLEIIGRRIKEDDIVEESIVADADANVAFEKATHLPSKGAWNKVVLWKEFDSMAEAPANDGCCYHLVDNGGKRTLRRCRKAQG